MRDGNGSGTEERGRRLFVDMDGVLADFDAHHEALLGGRPEKHKDEVDWSKVRAVEGFYETMPPMPDLPELWEFLKRYNPTVLTGVPKSVGEAAENKRAWARKHLGPGVPVITCRSSEKSKYARPGDILIDDWEKYRDKWEKAGGIWITHTSAKATIEALRGMGGGPKCELKRK